jgi:hypothetical protein
MSRLFQNKTVDGINEHADVLSASGWNIILIISKVIITYMSNIYLTFIRPVLEYACEVWDGCYERDIEKLEYC